MLETLVGDVIKIWNFTFFKKKPESLNICWQISCVLVFHFYVVEILVKIRVFFVCRFA